MSGSMNNLIDRRTFVSRYDNKEGMGHTTHIMDRNTFLKPENKDMRNEILERHSKIDSLDKSKVSVKILDNEERVKDFWCFQKDELADKDCQQS